MCSLGMRAKPSLTSRSTESLLRRRLLSSPIPMGCTTMTKKRFASSAHARRRAKNARHMPDSMLDLTDIPEATDAQLRRARRVGRPSTGNAKQLIAIRISPKVLARLRRLAAKQHKPYQTYIHELLEQAAGKKVAYCSHIK